LYQQKKKVMREQYTYMTTPPPPLTQQFPTAFYTTMATALTTVAALTWTDAIKTLFAPKGIFASSAKIGPWIVAVVATCLAILGGRVLYRVNIYTEEKLGTSNGLSKAE
jgi:hypothetical protein